jgi:hypothetical protein
MMGGGKEEAYHKVVGGEKETDPNVGGGRRG